MTWRKQGAFIVHSQAFDEGVLKRKNIVHVKLARIPTQKLGISAMSTLELGILDRADPGERVEHEQDRAPNENTQR